MGLAYKENVADTKESPARGIVERFFHKKSSKNCPSGGVTIFGQPTATDISCTSEIPPPSLAMMDGVIVTVVHDEFRGMGLRGSAWVYG